MGRYVASPLILWILMTGYGFSPPPQEPGNRAVDPVQVWISDGHAAEAGESLTIPVLVGRILEAHRIQSFELEILFDAALLDYTGLQLTGSLIETWDLVVDNEPTPGRVLISAASTAGSELTVDSDAVLLYLTFDVPGGAVPGCTDLTLEPSGFQFNAGEPSASLFDGEFCVVAAPAPSADLSLSGEISAQTASPGDTVTLSWTLTNHGPDAVGAVTVSAPLPAALTYAGDDAGGSYNAGSGDWTVGALASGSSATLNLTTTFNGGEAVSSAEVSASDTGDPDSTPGNGNGDEDDTAVLTVREPSADLDLAVRVSNTAPFEDEQVTFTLTLTNQGPDAATDIQVSAPLPSGLVGVVRGGVYSNGVWTIPALAAEASVTLEIDAVGSTAGSYTLTAEVKTVNENDPDSTPNNDDPTEDDRESTTVLVRPAVGAVIQFVSGNINGEGLTDNTPVAPVGGNPGATLGDRRRLALEHAASIWGSYLISDVTIRVLVEFTEGDCDGANGFMMRGTPYTASRAFSPGDSTWYPIALANAITGIDQNAREEIVLVINSAPDDGACRAATDWYYGLDAEPNGATDFVTQALVELARGLGFAPMVNASSGAELSGTDDIFSKFIKDSVSGKFWSAMSNSERLASAADPDNLRWTGTRTLTAAAERLNEGILGDGFLPMTVTDFRFDAVGSVAPDRFMFSFGDLNPDEMLEDGLTGANHDPGLAAEALYDLGWVPRRQADLRVEMTVDNMAAVPFEDIVFTITVTNDGPDDATEVEVTDLLPGGLSYTSHIASTGSYTPGNGLWAVGNLAAGVSATLELTVEVQPTGLKENVAEVTGVEEGDPDSSPDNGLIDEDDYAAVSVGSADLSLSLTADNLAPSMGDTVGLTITVTNDGPDSATGVEVKNLLSTAWPPVLVHLGDDSGGSYDTTTGKWQVGALASGDTAVLTIDVRVDAQSPVSNTAQITASDLADPDSTPGNNDAAEDDQETITLAVPNADLSLAFAPFTDFPNPGETIDVDLTVSNAGPNTATGVNTTILIPTGLSYVSHSGNGSYSSGSGIWNAGNLNSGASKTLTLTLSVDNGGTRTLSAEITNAPVLDPDSDPGNNDPSEDDIDTLTVTTAKADLSLVQSVLNGTANAGDDVTFILQVRNDGPQDASGVTVQHDIPAALSYQSHSGPGSYSSGSGLWTVGALASGATAELSVVARVTVAGTHVITAEVAASDQEDPDSTPGNGSGEDDFATVTVGKADLNLSMTVTEPTPFVGDRITFTLTVDNDGPEDATNVAVSVDIGDGLSLVDGSRTGSVFNWDVGALAAGSELMTQFSVSVDSIGGKFVTAEVSAVDHFDTDSTPNNGVIGEDDLARLLIAPRSTGSGARIVIVNMDGAGEGFNDPTPATPVGGNTGATLGEQRLQAFEYAASLWAANISSDVVIHVAAWFDPLFCSGSGAVLGQAAPWTVSRDFPNAPKTDTWYAVATANAIAGKDLNGGSPEIFAQFNSTLDSGCLGGKRWYYGFDRSGGGNFDAVSTILHEIGHGLGFLTLTQSNGARFFGRNDIYAFFLEDHSTGLTWDRLTDAQRAASITDSGDLHWVGPNVVANSGHLRSGRHSSGHVEMYAPNPVRPGSSTSHFSTSLSPNDLMEPFDTGPDHDLGLTANLMLDIGWPGQPKTDLSVTQTLSNAGPELGDIVSVTITVTNGGPAQTQEVTAQVRADAGLVYQGHSGDGSYTPGTGAWDIGLMEPGDQVTLTIDLLVDDLDPMEHRVEITGSTRPDPDSTPNNGSSGEDDDSTVTVEPFFVGVSDLSLSLGVDNTLPTVLDTITYSVSVTNDGPDVAGDVSVLFKLPAGLVYVSDTGDYNPASGIWTIGTLNAGATDMIDISVTVADAGLKTATAEVFLSGSDDPDSTPDNRDPAEDDRAGIDIDAQPLGTSDLSLVMGIDDQNPNPDETVTLTVDLANAGPDTAESIAVTVNLPTGYGLIGSGGDGTFSGNTWSPGDIASGDGKTLTVDLSAGSRGEKEVKAEVTSVLQDDPDSTPNNGNAAEDDFDRLFVQVPEADLQLNMTVSEPVVTVDDHVSFSLTVTNDNGPFDASGVSVKAQLPPGLTYVGHSGDGSYSDDTAVWTVGAVPVAGSASLAIEVSVDLPGARTLAAEIRAMDQLDSDSLPNNGSPVEDDRAEATVTTRATGGATIVILNADAAGEGFNDPTPTSPVGGNDGATLGQQRLNAFQHAADILGQMINSDVTIVVESNFDPLTCSSSSAVLGSAGAKNVARNFPGAPERDTWYHMALANAIAGSDLNGETAEIRARFNSSMDNNNNCLSGAGWYYGLDGNPGRNIDLVSVLLHEFAHGLGFSTFVNGRTGQRFLGMNDVYMKRLEDHAAGGTWDNLTDSGRAASAVRTGNLHWIGPRVTGSSGVLNAGVSNGHVEMYAPNPFRAGSSVSHFSTSLSPNELMEPSYTGPNHDPGLALALFADIGWNARGSADLSLGLQVDNPGAEPGDTVTFTLSVSNDGPEDAGAIIVDALLPPGLSFSGADGDGSYDDGTGEWTVGTVLDGNTAVVQIEAVVGIGVKTFSAEIAASDTGDSDSTPGNGQAGEDDSASASVGSADLTVTISADDLTPDEGGVVTLTVDVNNNGPDPTGDVTVLAPLPAGLSLSAVSHPGYNVNTGVWTVGDLNGARALASLSIEAVVTTAAPVTFEAELMTANLSDPDSTPGNGQPAEDDHDRIVLEPAAQPKADLSLAMTADDPAPFVGEPVTLRFTATNNGPETPQSVQVTVTLPAGINLIEQLGDGSYDLGLNRWNPPTLGPGSSASFELLVWAETAGVKEVSAEITGSSLPDPDSVPGNGNAAEDDQVSLELLPKVPVTTEIVILNADAPGEGFNDPTPAAPVGGNSGVTLGEQRLIAFRYAADIWASLLEINSTVVVRAKFDPLQCNSSSGVLGAAGPNSVEKDFPGAPKSGTWYHAALAHSIAGTDLNGADPEINATFNSQIDNNDGCMRGTNWYYGLDARPGSNIDLVSVLLHEFAHGLGFSTLVNGQTGATFQGFPDVFMTFLEDHSLNKNWPALTATQRANSARDTGDLHWTGASVNAGSGALTSGTGGGHVEMYAPGNYAPGSSVSHFSTSLAPNELMEPSYTGPNHNPGLSVNLMEDLGWGGRGEADLSLEVTVNDTAPDFGDTVTFTLTLTNHGPDELTSADIAAALPAGLTYVSDSGDYTAGVWSVSDLASGASDVLTLSATVASGSAMTFTGEVSFSAAADPDSTPGNGAPGEDDQGAVTIVPTGSGTADLSLTLTVSDTEPEVGAEITYTVTVSNAGPDTATSVKVVLPLDNSITWLSDTGDFNFGTGIWDVGSLTSGASDTIDITVRVNEQLPLLTVAEVFAADQEDPDSSPNNGEEAEDDRDSVTVVPVLVPRADLSLTVDVDNGNPLLGGLVNFTITVRNDGPVLATGIQVTAHLPLNLTLISASGDYSGGVWNLGDLPAGQSEALVVQVQANAIGLTAFEAEITAASPGDPDSTVANGNPAEDDQDSVNVVPKSGIGARIVILNADPPGTGFNDPTPVPAVGGNTGTTLGEQRLIAFQYAADLWGALLQSDVDIVVRANFGNLTCTSSGATLGSAGPKNVARDFANAPVAGTWYPMALANALAGTDLNGADHEINASFNGQLDSAACLGNVGWYYGLDQNPGQNIDLVTVLIHEMGHGLGFLSLMNSGGVYFQNLPDAYTRNLEDHSRNRMLTQLTQGERASAVVNSGNLHWIGDNVKAASTHLTAGRTSSGHVEMFAPNPYQSGSSVSHYSNSLVPLDFMRAYYGAATHEMGLGAALMYDIGWEPPSRADLALAGVVDNPAPLAGDTVTFTLTLGNDGPEPATGVEVAIFLPSGLDYAGDNGGGSYDSGTGIWTPAALPNGSVVELELSVTVLADGDKSLIAEVALSDQNDPDSRPGNGAADEDDYTRVSVGEADISLDLASAVNNAVVGDVVPFSLSITNDGPNPASGLSVAVTLPAGLTLAAGALDSGLWEPADLPAGASEHLDFSVRVESAGALEVIVELVGAGDPDPDSTPDNGAAGEDDLDSHTIDVTAPVVDLDIEYVLNRIENCPDIAIWVQVTNNGEAVNSLSADNFTILEDGVPVPFVYNGATLSGDYELVYTTQNTDGQKHTIDVSVTYEGETAFFNQQIQNCLISGVIDITNGETITGIGAAPGDWAYFRLEVPPLQDRLEIQVFGGAGDFDLFVKKGDLPALGNYDHMSWFNQPGQPLVIENPQPGEYFLGVYAASYLTDVNLFAQYSALSGSLDLVGVYTDNCPNLAVDVEVTMDGNGVGGLSASDFTLSEDGLAQSFTVTESQTPGFYTLNYTTAFPDGGTHLVEVSAQVIDLSLADSADYRWCELSGVVDLANGEVVTDLDGAKNSWKHFRIAVPAGQDTLDIEMFGGKGDADLYVRRGSLPDLGSFDAAPFRNGNDESVRFDNPVAGDYYISLFGFRKYRDLSLTAKYEAADLMVTIDSVSVAECPKIVVQATVTSGGTAVTDIGAPEVQLQDGYDPPIDLTSWEHLGGGTYQFDYDTTNTDGGVNYFLLTILRGSGAFASGSFSGCLRDGGLLDVWINGEHGAPAGDEILIPVRVQAVEAAFEVRLFRFDVFYDPTVLEFLGQETADTLVEEWDFVESTAFEPGRVVVNASDIDQLTLSTEEPGELIGLRFRVQPEATEDMCSDLRFDPSFFMFNGGNPLARTGNGQFCVTEGACPRALGDINGDGDDDQAFDALQILNAVSGVATDYDPLPLCVADTNCSGDITVMDAVLILQKNVELIANYCQGVPTRGSGSIDIGIPAEDLTVDVGTSFELRIQLDQLPVDPVYGYSFDITYDPSLITLRTDTRHEETLSRRWSAPVVSREPGRLTVTQVSPVNAIDGTGTLLSIRGTANPINTGTTQLEFTRFSIAVEGETEQTFGPFNLTVGGTPCFRTDLYETYLNNWPNGSTVRDLVDLFNCNR
ncbi:MAG: CARDB domain-containing protein [Acidobacteriota bacterium]|nr:CARDB domain-containing protein [Acidobacteriota bacterium]